MTLNDIIKNTAEAIREKTGKKDKISPINFAEEIKGITKGIECFFYDQRGTTLNHQDLWREYSTLIKVDMGDTKVILPTLSLLRAGREITNDNVVAVCIANPKITNEENGALRPFIEGIPSFEELPFITEEEFYDQNS